MTVKSYPRRKKRNTEHKAFTVNNAYDMNGNLRFSTDANVITTENCYDGLNRVVSIKVTVNGEDHITTKDIYNIF